MLHLLEKQQKLRLDFANSFLLIIGLNFSTKVMGAKFLLYSAATQDCDMLEYRCY